MRTKNTGEARRHGEYRASDAEIAVVGEDMHAPRKLTLAENIILTIKILAVAGVVIGMIWGVNLWTSPK